MIENLRRSGQRVVVVAEVKNEEHNGRSEERGRRRDSETGAASEQKTSFVLPRQDMFVYEGGGEEIECKKPSSNGG